MKILLLAGEESGLLYANRIAEKIRESRTDVEIRGYADYGFKTGDLAVMGIVPILMHIGFFLGVSRTMKRAIDEWKPDVVCTVDYPGMNMRLAAYAKSRGIRTIHVVCPQVWAWKRGRIPKIEAAFDRLCCFFPFEPKLFRPGFAEFVGHPLVDAFAGLSRKQAEDGTSVLAVLPGSRLTEIKHILPVLMKTVERLRSEGLGFGVVIPAANEKAFDAIKAKTRGVANVDVQLGGARELLLRADCAVVASGTATLEAALARCPTVLVYKVDPLFAMICRIVIKGVKHIGLANVIAEKAGMECPMTELLQENFTAAGTAAELKPLLADSTARSAAAKRLDETMALLGSEGEAMTNIVCMILN